MLTHNLPLKYHVILINPESDERCTWEDFGLKIKIGDGKYLEEKFSFDEQGIILQNEQ